MEDSNFRGCRQPPTLLKRVPYPHWKHSPKHARAAKCLSRNPLSTRVQTSLSPLIRVTRETHNTPPEVQERVWRAGQIATGSQIFAWFGVAHGSRGSAHAGRIAMRTETSYVKASSCVECPSICRRSAGMWSVGCRQNRMVRRDNNTSTRRRLRTEFALRRWGPILRGASTNIALRSKAGAENSFR